MSMHLTHFTTTNKRIRKAKKWASSEAKQKDNDLKKSWDDLLKKHSPKKVPANAQSLTSPGRYIDPSRLHANIPSRDSGGFARKIEKQVYTGKNIIGLATMHKSNIVPVFESEAAKDLARMRRG